MEDPAKVPSLPSNYVSILDLRERWLKQNERIHKEKEEEEQSPPERQVQEQVVERSNRKSEDGEPVIRKPRIHTTSRSNKRSGQFRMVYRVVPASNRRNVNERCKKTETEGGTEPRIGRDEKEKKAKRKGRKKNPRAKNEGMDRTSRTPEENLKEETRETDCELGVQIKKDIVNERCKTTDAEGKTESLVAKPRIGRDEKNKKSKRNDRKKNPRSKNKATDRTLRTPEDKNLKEEIPETECELGVKNEKKNVRAEKMDEKKEIGIQCEPEEIGDIHEMKEMENKLSRISVSFGVERRRNNGVFRGRNHGKQNFRHHQNLHRWGPRKQRNVGMIWVRKDEHSEGVNS